MGRRMRSGNSIDPNQSGRTSSQGGFTLLATLAAMLVLAVSTQAVMTVLATQAQRERELLLLKTGSAIRDAIERYVQSTPGAQIQWPRRLQDLLDDQRSLVIRRHLRELYADPMNPSGSWGLITAPDGGIAGVYSLSQQTPVRTGGVELDSFGVAPASRYDQWRFVYVPAPGQRGHRESR
jgi:type II secretory pathway pseudopilin PulG